jgi:hypothetical protein
MLAPAAPVASRAGLGRGPPNAAELARGPRRDRLDTGQPGQHQRACQRRRRGGRPQSRRSRQGRQQLSPARGPAGHPAGGRLSAANVHDCKLLEPLVDAVPPIRQPLGLTGSATVPAGQTARRQGLRLRLLPPGSAAARYHASDRPTRHRVERAARSLPVDRGTDECLGARLPPPNGPL